MRFTFHLFILDIYFIHLSINEKKAKHLIGIDNDNNKKCFHSPSIYLLVQLYFSHWKMKVKPTHTHIIEQTNVPETMKNVIVRFFSFLSISNVFFSRFIDSFLDKPTNQPTMMLMIKLPNIILIRIFKGFHQPK